MSFDSSRFPFNPWNDFFGPVMQQGRVHLDSDWNEWVAEFARRVEAGTLDIVGRAVVPATTPNGFKINVDPSGQHLTIGTGRMYVDGLMVENHGPTASAVWDTALAEMSGAPAAPPMVAELDLDYGAQPYLLNATLDNISPGPFLVYLDVWKRAVTYLEYPELIDSAVGVDTTGRVQMAWQVKLLDVSQVAGVTCATPDDSILPWKNLIQPSGAQLTTAVLPSATSGPCCLNTATGYTGMENQLYRVEIHQGGTANSSGTSATFKWSRDNASVITAVTAVNSATNVANNPTSQLTVQSTGRDNVLSFKPGDWIEITDDFLELNGQAGELHQIDSNGVSKALKTITLQTPVSQELQDRQASDFDYHPRICRWDQNGKVYQSDGVTVWADLTAAGSSGQIPVPPPGTSLMLENGVTVTFSLNPAVGNFRSADFWTFPARASDGTIEILTAAAPMGIHHHYARLSVVDFSVPSASDCRTLWPPSSDSDCGCCCTCTVGDGVESVGKFASIQSAIDALPASGGAVCILPGRYYEHVFIENRHDVVLRGCGGQTRIASPSLKPLAAESAASQAPSTASTSNTLVAVITVSASAHIELRSFAVEAADQEVGILVDGSGTLSGTRGTDPGQPRDPTRVSVGEIQTSRIEVIDTTIEDLVLTASTLPAILAQRVNLLQVEKNRIAMKNVPSKWPAVWVSGAQIRIGHNWVGIQSAVNVIEWLPTSVTADLSSDTVSGVAHPGGVQIAGPSQDVFIIENEIEGGARNGITLGSFTILDANGRETGEAAGVFIAERDRCSTTSTLVPPTTSPQRGRVVAGGRLINIQIDRNRIRNTGLCGIGPVGFFNLLETPEVITVENLTISSNAISDTLQNPLAALNQDSSPFGYGAICVPDVQNLIIRDNTITNFGAQPGLDVCGIFILHGEMIEISRTHVFETRDWSPAPRDEPSSASGAQAGILAMMVTPPALDQAATAAASWISTVTEGGSSAAPIYQPGLPALRLEHNEVRVALGEALEVVGFGPFSIVNNHFSTGGTVTVSGSSPAMTVMILNLGVGVELANPISSYANLYYHTMASVPDLAGSALASSSSGAVLFTNNICQLETRASRQRGLSSVMIASLDHVIFADNHCWLDSQEMCAALDAIVLAVTLQVNSNRFQESRGSVLASGLTCGFMNVTSQNLSTYCLFAKAIDATKLMNNNNVTWVDTDTCDRLWTLIARANS